MSLFAWQPLFACLFLEPLFVWSRAEPHSSTLMLHLLVRGSIGQWYYNRKWFPSELLYHINADDLLAAYIALKHFKSDAKIQHIKLMLDSTTAVAVINDTGTNHSDNCNASAIKMWSLCFKYNMWLAACHIPGKASVITDRENFGSSLSIMLNG